MPQLTSHDGNNTITTTQILTQIEGGLIVLPMIGFLESVAIAKAFARKNKYKVDPSQELIALGLANFIGAFCSAYPVTGSFSRTAVNSISGVATPLGGSYAFCYNTCACWSIGDIVVVSIRDDPHWIFRKNCLELIDLSIINKVSLV